MMHGFGLILIWQFMTDQGCKGLASKFMKRSGALHTHCSATAHCTTHSLQLPQQGFAAPVLTRHAGYFPEIGCLWINLQKFVFVSYVQPSCPSIRLPRGQLVPVPQWCCDSANLNSRRIITVACMHLRALVMTLLDVGLFSWLDTTLALGFLES